MFEFTEKPDRLQTGAGKSGPERFNHLPDSSRAKGHRPTSLAVPGLCQPPLRRAGGVLLILAALFAAAVLFAPSPAQAQTMPTISTVAFTSSAGTDNTYAIGDTISVTVTFSAAVAVTGTPQIELNMGGTPTQADYSSGTGTVSLVFTHEVVENDEDTDGLSIDANKLTLNSGTIKLNTDSTVDATLTHSAVATQASHKVDGVRPTFVSAATSTDGAKITVTFSETMGTTTTNYSVMRDTTATTVSQATVSESKVELTLGAAVQHGQSVTLDMSADRATDAAGNGNAAASPTTQSVTNNVPEPPAKITAVAYTSDPGTDKNYVTGESIKITVTFDKAVDVVTTDGTPRIGFNLSDSGEAERKRWANYESGTGGAGIVFSYTVASADESDTNGIGIDPFEVDLNSGSIVTASKTIDATLDFSGITVSSDNDGSHLVNWTPPAFDSAATSDDGAKVVVTFSENLDEDTPPTTDRFTVKVDGTDSPLSGEPTDSLAVSGKTVTLLLVTAATYDETLTVSYTDLSTSDDTSGVVQDLRRNDAPAFTDQAVTNNLPDPATVSAVAIISDPNDDFRNNNDDTNNPVYDDDTYTVGYAIKVRVTFSETVTGTPRLELDIGGKAKQARYDSGTGTDKLVFAYTVSAGDLDSNGISVGADKLTLNGGTIKNGATLSNLDHAALADDAGHKVEAVLPTLESAVTSTDGTKIFLTYSEDLFEDHRTLRPFFTAKVDGDEVALGGQALVPIDGKVVTLTLATALTSTQSLTLSYKDNSRRDRTATIEDLVGNDALDFTDQPVTNNVGAIAVNFAQTSYSVTEFYGADADNPGVSVTVTLASAPGNEVVIPLTKGGTASVGDYRGVPSSLTFGASDTTKSFTVKAVGDARDEEEETLVIGLGTLPTGIGTGARSQTTVTIQDIDTLIDLKLSAPKVSEDDGSATLSITATTRENRPPTITANLVVLVRPGTAIVNQDFTGDQVQTMNFLISEFAQNIAGTAWTQTKTISVTLNDDTVSEPDETLHFDIAYSHLYATERRLLRHESAPNTQITSDVRTTVTIEDDDDPEWEVTSDPDQIPEMGGASTLTVSTGGVSFLEDRTFTLDLTGSDATDGTDFELKQGTTTLTAPYTLTLPMGDTSASVTIASIDDTTSEESETVKVTVRLGDDVLDEPATTVIRDDEGIRVSFGAASYEVADGGTVTVTAKLTNGTPTETITIPLTLSRSEGLRVNEATASVSSLTFGTGITQTTFTVTTVDDDVDEPNEVLTIGIGDPLPTGYVPGNPLLTRIIIQDDDHPYVGVSLEPLEPSVTEGDSITILVSVDIDKGPERDVTVPLRVTGSAAAADYSGMPATVTIGADETSTTFTVTATDDSVQESGETITIEVWVPLPVRVFRGSAATLTINDDDGPPGPPSGLSPAMTNRKVTLTWEPPDPPRDSTVLGYQARYNDGDTWSAWTGTDSNAKHAFTGLYNGTAYTFEVRARNENGDGEATSTTGSPTRQTTGRPEPPQNVTVRSWNSQRPGIGWVRPSNAYAWHPPGTTLGGSYSRILGYRIEVCTASDCGNDDNWRTLVGNTNSTHTQWFDEGVTDLRQRKYRVFAFNINGVMSEASNVASLPPTVVENFAARHILETDAFVVRFQVRQPDGQNARLRVHRHDNPDAEQQDITIPLTRAGAYEQRIENTTPGKTYWVTFTFEPTAGQTTTETASHRQIARLQEIQVRPEPAEETLIQVWSDDKQWWSTTSVLSLDLGQTRKYRLRLASPCHSRRMVFLERTEATTLAPPAVTIAQRGREDSGVIVLNCGEEATVDVRARALSEYDEDDRSAAKILEGAYERYRHTVYSVPPSFRHLDDEDLGREHRGLAYQKGKRQALLKISVQRRPTLDTPTGIERVMWPSSPNAEGLQWTAVAGATSYQVEWRFNDQQWWTVSTQYKFPSGAATGMPGSGFYKTGVRIRALNATEVSRWSGEFVRHAGPRGMPRMWIEDSEGHEDQGKITFKVKLDRAPLTEVTAQYVTRSGSAKSGQDYRYKTGAITIPAGRWGTTITVTILDDNVEDDGEKFSLVLSNPSGAIFSDSTATGIIGNVEEASTGLTAMFPSSKFASSSHTGASDRPQVVVAFSEAVTGVTATTPSVSVSGGNVSSVSQTTTEGISNAWVFIIQPTGTDDITFRLVPNQACDSGGICGPDSVLLKNVPDAHTVPGPSNTEESIDENMEESTPANTTATGAPAVSGAAHVGETLTVDTSGINDADGLANVSYSFQWIQNDGSADSDIAGATGSTYDLVDADRGKTIKVKVSFTDDQGNQESLTSAATVTVGAALLKASFPDAPASHDGSNAFTFELRFSENVRMGFQKMADHVLTVTGGEVASASRVEQGSNIRWQVTVDPSGNGDVTVTLPETTGCSAQGSVCTHGGKMLSRQVSLTVAGPQSQEQETVETNNAATGAPTISGTAQVGQTLTVGTSDINDADGLDDVSYSYQWTRSDGTTDSDIAGATGSTYELTSSDQGETVKVRLSFTDDRGNSESLISAATGAVAARHNNAATGAPTISGTAQVGQTLTASTSAISDSDGLDDVSYSYQWIRSDGETDSDIAGATSSTYELTIADQGKTVKVRVTFTDDRGNSESLTSAATGAVAARPNNAATGAPTVSGTAQVGQTLTASTSAISDADGLDNVSYSYQWIRNDGTTDSDIAGATGSTYELVDADQGKTIKVRVAFTDDWNNRESLTSVATGTVAPRPDLTAAFESEPESHDGTNAFTFELRFSETVKLSYKSLRDHGFQVTGGSVTKARRMEQGSNIRWEIHVQPSGNGDVTIVLPKANDCDDDGAVCTGDGRKLSNRSELTVGGPGD